MRKPCENFSMSLSSMIVLSITVACVAVAGICNIIFASVYSRTLIRGAKVNSEQAVEQTTDAINNFLSSMKEKIKIVCKLINESESEKNFGEKILTLSEIQKDVYAVTLYDENKNIIRCAGSGGKLKSYIYNNLSLKDEFFNKGDFAISDPHVQNFFECKYPWVVTLAVKTDDYIFKECAYISIDFSFSKIAKYIDNVGVGMHGYCYVIGNNGEIVYHPQQQLLFSGLKSENNNLISGLSDGAHEKKNAIITLKTTTDGLWRIVGQNFTYEIAVERRDRIITSIIFTPVFCAAIVAIVLLVYSKTVMAPMRLLIGDMKTFQSEANDYKDSDETGSVRELIILSESFKNMKTRIFALIERVRTEQIELRKTELKALQAQINPHFLYNTLDSVQWMCEQNKNQEAIIMIGALARLFRISISHGRELISIRDELQHARSYLLIQSYRYRNQFEYVFNVEEELLDYLCNKITIQPLVENSIYHGINRMVDKGKITISVKQADDDPKDIHITVEDNGIGMTKQQCETILQKSRSDSRGIGIKNVNDRLKIYFGDKYSISIFSEQDVGTKVTVRIPKITEEAGNEIQ